MAHYAEFLEGLLSAPRAVSAPAPSGRPLAAAIASMVDAHRRGIVVELGPGTGTITQALVDQGISSARILAVECVPYFANLLRQRFPAVDIYEGDAFAFEQYLPPGCQVSAIISGIPLLNFEPRKRTSLIHRGMEMCGSFVQLSYGWIPPIKPEPGTNLTKTIVWRNFPPAHVWKYSVTR